MCFYNFFYWTPKVLDWDSVSKSNDSNLGWKNAMRTSLICSIFQNKQIDTSTDLLCLSAMNEDQNKQNKTKKLPL